MSEQITKTIREGKLIAEVRVDLIPDDGAWGPYISATDARKLDRVRQALRKGDVAEAAKDAKVYETMLLAGE